MIEVLYHPKSNRLVLFYGEYKINKRKRTMTLFVRTDIKKSGKSCDPSELVHLGWL